ncbi:unnamed protein product [Meganyctiphanes norvegica]|uniref:Uncharacterized protein n=1 Tax=Meganyctiphanes norvegica TaxID=48144 RepID=A0AAV2R715_MEGNR
MLFQIIVLVLVGFAALWKIWKFKNANRWSLLRDEWSKIGKDVVVLHQFQRGKTCPNISPFALKVESFLRVANIKYKVEEEKTHGPTRGKCPWITFNGDEVEDSELIINYLTKNFDIHLDDHLTTKKKANLHALRILGDEHLFWLVCTYRYVHDKCNIIISTQSFPWFISLAFRTLMPYFMQRKASHHGIGLFTHEELYQMCYKSCQTLSYTLDNDSYFGGEQPCTTDCCMFGHLAQLMWNAPGTRYEALLKEEFPNLAEYCDRMKNFVFPDWNQLLKPPQ